jgi:molybdate transport system substrate-binding protein
MRSVTVMLLLCGLAVGVASGAAEAAEIKVLSAGAMRGVIDALLPDFEKQTGHKVAVENATAGVLAKRIEDGEAFDLAVVTAVVVDGLAGKGKIAGDSRKALAKVGMGVAVKAGAPLPDIKTVDAFKRTLLEAKSVAYINPKAGGTTGAFFEQLIEKLGIADEVRAKAKLKDGGYVADLVASGEAEVGVHVISEIVPVKGAVLVGPLPAEIQTTTTYVGGISAASANADAAKALIEFIAGPASGPVLKAKGMDKP